MKGIKAQTHQCRESHQAILTAGKTSLDKAIKVTVLMKNIKDFAKTNDAYCTFFSANPPACSCIEVKSLAHERVEIEIDCVAAI